MSAHERKHGTSHIGELDLWSWNWIHSPSEGDQLQVCRWYLGIPSDSLPVSAGTLVGTHPCLKLTPWLAPVDCWYHIWWWVGTGLSTDRIIDCKCWSNHIKRWCCLTCFAEFMLQAAVGSTGRVPSCVKSVKRSRHRTIGREPETCSPSASKKMHGTSEMYQAKVRLKTT